MWRESWKMGRGALGELDSIIYPGEVNNQMTDNPSGDKLHFCADNDFGSEASKERGC